MSRRASARRLEARGRRCCEGVLRLYRHQQEPSSLYGNHERFEAASFRASFGSEPFHGEVPRRSDCLLRGLFRCSISDRTRKTDQGLAPFEEDCSDRKGESELDRRRHTLVTVIAPATLPGPSLTLGVTER